MVGFTHVHRVRYHECDAQGVVFNAHHITYVDVTLTELWREAFGGSSSFTADGLDVVVADVHAAYRGPVRFDEELAVTLTVERLGRTSMTSRWSSTVGDRLCVEGEIVHVWVDQETLEPTEIPERIRDALASYAA